MLFSTDIQIPANLTPREFQQIGFNKLINNNEKWVVHAPTAAGKTFLMLMLAKYHIESNRTVLISVYMLEVLNQLIEQSKKWNFNFGVIQGNHILTNPSAPLQLASNSTVSRRDWQEYNIIIVDEVHYLNKAMFNMIKAVNNQVLGFSATPFNKGLYEIFNDNVLNLATAKELTAQGILVPLKIISARRINVNNLKKDSYGEYSTSSIESAGKEILGDAVQSWTQYANNQQTLIFCASISHARMVADAFNDAGITAAVYCADTPIADRIEYVKNFKKSKLKILCSVSAIATGFDVPIASVMIDMRPLRKSFSTLVQSIGRILRSAPGKTHALLIDCTGNILRMADDYIDLFNNGVTRLSDVEKKDKIARDNLPKLKEKKSSGECPNCKTVNMWLKTTCLACGFTIPPKLVNLNLVTKDVKFEEVDLFTKLDLSAKKNVTNMVLWKKICAYIWVNTPNRYFNEDVALKKAKSYYYNITNEWAKYGEKFIKNTKQDKIINNLIRNIKEKYKTELLKK